MGPFCFYGFRITIQWYDKFQLFNVLRRDYEESPRDGRRRLRDGRGYARRPEDGGSLLWLVLDRSGPVQQLGKGPVSCPG